MTSKVSKYELKQIIDAVVNNTSIRSPLDRHEVEARVSLYISRLIEEKQLKSELYDKYKDHVNEA